MKPKSPIVVRLDEIQSRIGKSLQPLGFKRKGRTFRRETDHEVLQIIALQAGPFEIGPPLPPSVSYMRPDLYGKFTINLGVFVPEIHERTNPPVTKSRVINDAYCSIRTRLSHIGEGEDVWWSVLDCDDEDIEDIIALLLHVGIGFLDRFRTRELIVRDWISENERIGRLDVAMILLRHGDKQGARRLFEDHLKVSEAEGSEPFRVNHRSYVRELAARLGLGELP